MLLTLWTIKLKTSSLSPEKVEGPNNCYRYNNKNQVDLKKKKLLLKEMERKFT